MTARVMSSWALARAFRGFLCNAELARCGVKAASSLSTALMLIAGLTSAGALCAQPFTLWVAETSPGGSPQYLDHLSGNVRSYVFDGHGYGANHFVPGPTIPASGLHDPADVTLGPSGALYIANRNFGDDSNQNKGSVAKVILSDNVPHAPQVVISNLDVGTNQIAFTSKGDLVATSFSSGTKLYPGITTPATISFPTGFSRGALAQGNLLYSTSASDTAQTFDLTTGALESSFVVSGSHLPHFITAHHGALYIADIGSNMNAGNGALGGVFKVSLDANGLPTSSTRLLDLDGAISVAFSPQGDEMFVATHFTGLIEGFAVGPGDSVSSTPNLVIDGGILGIWNGAHASFGGMEITAVPEPATYVLMLAALCAIAARLLALRNASSDGEIMVPQFALQMKRPQLT